MGISNRQRHLLSSPGRWTGRSYQKGAFRSGGRSPWATEAAIGETTGRTQATVTLPAVRRKSVRGRGAGVARGRPGPAILDVGLGRRRPSPCRMHMYTAETDPSKRLSTAAAAPDQVRRPPRGENRQRPAEGQSTGASASQSAGQGTDRGAVDLKQTSSRGAETSAQGPRPLHAPAKATCSLPLFKPNHSGVFPCSRRSEYRLCGIKTSLLFIRYNFTSRCRLQPRLNFGVPLACTPSEWHLDNTRRLCKALTC